MQKILTSLILAAAFSLHAGAPPRGTDRLRELVVFPAMNLDLHFGIHSSNRGWLVSDNVDVNDKITQLQAALKQRPDDIDQLFQLGNAFDETDDTNKANACYQKIEKLCRDKITASPQDGLSLTTLGQALVERSKPEEAESVLRKATLISSNDWRCWAGLGNFLASRSFYWVLPEGTYWQIGQVPTTEVLAYLPPPEAVKKAESSIKEAGRCYDRAVALAPREPEAFFQRAGFMSISNALDCYLRNYRDQETIKPKTWVVSFFSKETTANLRKAAELKSGSSQYLGLATYFDLFRAITLGGYTNLIEQQIPDEIKREAHKAMAQLEKISEGGDKELAAEALENLGMINLFLENKAASADAFRHAVALDPTRELSWEGLMLMLAMKDTPSETDLLAVCQARLKAKNSLRNHLILSKELAEMKKWQTASEQAKIAGGMDTNNIVPPLLLAAIALMQSTQTNYLPAAEANLKSAGELLVKMPDGEEKNKRGCELLLNSSIYFALANDPERARFSAQQALKYFPDDQRAKDILNAIP